VTDTPEMRRPVNHSRTHPFVGWAIGMVIALLGLAILISGRSCTRSGELIENTPAVWVEGLFALGLGAFAVVQSIRRMGGDEITSEESENVGQ
jgi:hypothetical protein